MVCVQIKRNCSSVIISQSIGILNKAIKLEIQTDLNKSGLSLAILSGFNRGAESIEVFFCFGLSVGM